MTKDAPPAPSMRGRWARRGARHEMGETRDGDGSGGKRGMATGCPSLSWVRLHSPGGSQGVSEPPLAAGSAATVRCPSEGCRRRARCAGQGARTARVPLCLRAVPGCTHPIAHPLRAGLHSASFLLRHGPKGAPRSAGGNGASASCTPPSPAPAPRAAKLTQVMKRGAKRGAAGGSRCVPRGVTPAGRLGAGALQSPGGRIWRRRRRASVG